MRGEFLRLERDGDAALLVLDRPPLNVLHTPMLRELGEALDRIAADDKAKVLVVTGAGLAFCAGVDVADHARERVGTTLDLFHGAIRRLLALEMPVVAAVNGAALGGGCEIALACDVVLARAGAKLGQPEIRLAAFPPVAAALLPRLVGRQRALDLILTGRPVPAEEALSLGLVGHVYAEDVFDTAAAEYVRSLASLSRPVLRLAKRAVMEGLERPATSALAKAEALYLDELVELRDSAEGLAAFLEKRQPAWSDA